jgi:hypothetical protein
MKKNKTKVVRGSDAWDTNKKATEFLLKNPDYKLESCDSYKATFIKK